MSLITPSQLQDLLEDPSLLVFDVRHNLFDVEAGRTSFREGHIPGAYHLHMDDDLSGEIIPGKTGRHPLPPVEVFTAKMSLFDLDAGKQVVVYDDKGGALAARLWWMLRAIGHENVRVLDGGYPAWVHANLPVQTEQVPLPATDYRRGAAAYPVSTYQLRTCGSAQIRQLDESATLVDSRTAERYRGEHEPIDPVAGHIPGAVNYPWPDNLNADGTFKDQDQLKIRFATLGDKADDPIFYCGSGVTACHNLLAFERAFGRMGTLYAGSWSEFIVLSL
ncbi:sulfurtransferase [Lewinella sp. 4G2]|uniref:sulfurtransferase n=1 Tax=Lewinella sp. 4G2 TaxID=1803372 RepID=UPI0007B4B2ED|nr:sulfurtransferase [Lewinella sp. 4G2]OAV43873.1 hypothetical protein A3850_004890 [Lewinella sp. 4G2]